MCGLKYKFDELAFVGTVLVAVFEGGGALLLLSGGIGNWIWGWLDRIVGFISGGSEELKKAYNLYQSTMKDVHWVNGYFLNWSSNSTTVDYISAFFTCALHTIDFNAKCLIEASK